MNDRIENTNIEQSKALFEYEMTEVLLQLQGEFAVFSGKNTKFAESNVDDQKLVVNIPPLPAAEITAQAPKIPAVPDGDVSFCAQIPEAECKASVPQIPDIAAAPSFPVDAVVSALSETQTALLDQTSKIVLPAAPHAQPISPNAGVKVPAVPGKDSLPGPFDFAPKCKMPKMPAVRLPERTALAPLPAVSVSMEENRTPSVSPMTELEEKAAGLRDAAPAPGKYRLPDTLKLPQSASVQFAPSVQLPSMKQHVPQVREIRIPALVGEPLPQPVLPAVPEVRPPMIKRIPPVVTESARKVYVPEVREIRLRPRNAQKTQKAL